MNQQTKSKWLKRPSNQIALFAIIVSTLGFMFSVYYNRQTLKIAKTHNELSVKPILQVSCIVNRVDGYVKFDLLNKGLGPAIISELVYDFENKTFSNYRDFFEAIKNRANLNDTIFTFNHRQIFKHMVLSANEEIQLGKIFIEPYTLTDSIASILDDAKVLIKYKDVYDNEFEQSTEL